LIAHAEEIAFYKGNKREQMIVNSSFDAIYNAASLIFKKQAVIEGTSLFSTKERKTRTRKNKECENT